MDLSSLLVGLLVGLVVGAVAAWLAATKLREAFKSLSADALHANNQAFLDLASQSLGQFQQGARAELDGRQQAIDELVKPIRESLDGVDSKVALVFSADRRLYLGSSAEYDHHSELARSADHGQAAARRIPRGGLQAAGCVAGGHRARKIRFSPFRSAPGVF